MKNLFPITNKLFKRLVAFFIVLTIFASIAIIALASTVLDGDSVMLGDSNIMLGGSNTVLPIDPPSSESDDQLDGPINLGESGEVQLGFSSFGARAGFDGESIAGIIAPEHLADLVVIPYRFPNNYATFPVSEGGLRSALAYIYNRNDNDNYIIYFGQDLTIDSSPGADTTGIGRKDPPTSPSENDITFTSLKGRAASLTFVGIDSDPLTSTNSAPAGATTFFSYVGKTFFDTNVKFRNINHWFHTIYSQGNDLTLDRGSFCSSPIGVNIYGGTDWGDVTGNVNITVNSTGKSAITNIIGGNQEGGTLTGDINIVINDTSSDLTTLWGGSADGDDIIGNISITVNGTSGNIDDVRGAGGFCNVSGNVSTSINGLSGVLGSYYGGSSAGHIGGVVSNKISGAGAFNTPTTFYGGSYLGNIGSGAGNAITTVLDTSGYSAGSIEFYGANESAGHIYGNISNTLTLGDYNDGGSAYTVHGGSGPSTYQPELSSELFDKVFPEQRPPVFENLSSFRLYGNLTTEITKGCLGDNGNTSASSFSSGAGYAGYIQGNVTTIIGSQGLVYGGDNKNIDRTLRPSTDPTQSQRGLSANHDFAGGGGFTTGEAKLFINGDTKLVQYNTLLRSTFGGSYSGYIQGNTYNELHGGIVDVLSGGGVREKRIWGNSYAKVLGGQVDNMLGGGGFSDLTNGDVEVTVTGGIINASLGGYIGGTTGRITTGNSNILVKGGDFSGVPRIGNKTFSGGSLYTGHVQGNSTVTLDLRGTSAFIPPTIPISGGRYFGAGDYIKLGTDESNTINLNIFTDPGNNVLSDKNMFGDGGINSSTFSGSITVNIDSDGSDIGNVYATEYSNIGSNKILKDVEFNVKGANSINGISGGSPSDNFTNTVASAGTKNVVMNFASQSPIDIGSDGFINFTEFNVDGTILNASGIGSILNGKNATAANHGATYSDFGDINLKNGGSFSINSPIAIISGGKMTIDGDVSMSSVAGHGKVNLSAFDAINGGRLHWVNTSASSDPIKGTWFGDRSSGAYRVLTFSPSRDAALNVTPINLYGTNSSGLYFAGDNDVKTDANFGYGVVTPAYQLKFDVIAGLGGISHNVDNVVDPSVTPNPVSPVTAVGSVAKDTLVQSGWLIVPAGVPELTFQPDIPSGSGFENATITDSRGFTLTLPASIDNSPKKWTPLNPYEYTIDVSFSDTPRLYSQNAIITESEASLIVAPSTIIALNQAAGRPFFTHDISSATITAINQPLANGTGYRIHDIVYSAGVGIQQISMTAQIFVVPDDTFFSGPDDRSFAVWAQDATMTVTQAQGIDRTQLDSVYTKPFGIFFLDGAVVIPNINTTAISDINSVTNPTTVPVTYSFGPASKTVTVTVQADAPILLNVPDLQFGTKTITGGSVKYTVITDAISKIEDKRSAGKNWTLKLKVDDLTTSTPVNTIPASSVLYVENGSSLSLDVQRTVASGVSDPLNTTQTITWLAGDDTHGVIIESDGTLAKGAYGGTLTWSLEFTP